MITIVTGVPRSGTSMTMRILDMGGIPAVHDPKIHADINKYGSFETNKLDDLSMYDGKSVKCMAFPLIFDAPVGDYRIIMPIRDVKQTLLSRKEAFKMKDMPNIEQQAKHTDRQRRMIKFFIKHRPDMKLLEIPYEDYFDKTEKVIDDIATFLGVPFDKEKALKAVDKSLLKLR